MHRDRFTLRTSVAALVLFPCIASAQPPTTSGDIALTTAPSSLELHHFESNSIRLIAESDGVVAEAPVTLDIVDPGDYEGSATLYLPKVSAGTQVNSYLLHGDDTQAAGGITLTGSVTFPADILGVIALDPELDGTDASLGHAGTIYPTGLDKREMDFVINAPNEFITISTDLRTLTLKSSVWNGVDHVRILTASTSSSVSVTGAIQVVSAPASVALNAYQSDTKIRLFLESQGIELEEDVPVDIIDPGTYVNTTPVNKPVLPAGTAISSYLLHFDPVGTSHQYAEGSVTFAQEIHGLILGTPELEATDATLGAPGTVYPVDLPLRQFDFVLDAPYDTLSLSADRKTLTVTSVTQDVMDNVRIVLVDQCLGDDETGDVDLDGYCSDVDNCPLVGNPGQADGDSDGIGDACE
jgi:hypothetical protein